MLVLALLVSLACGMIGSRIALHKNLNVKFHSVLGVVFGPIGVLYSALMPSRVEAV
ncbi:MAG: hypothetical protein ABJN11_07455 [Lentilitoribacter sp.]